MTKFFFTRRFGYVDVTTISCGTVLIHEGHHHHRCGWGACGCPRRNRSRT